MSESDEPTADQPTAGEPSAEEPTAELNVDEPSADEPSAAEKPDVLDSDTAPGVEPEPRRRSGRRTAAIVAGAVVGLGAIGGAAALASWYFLDGPQAAEALPDSTIAYVQVNLDPSGDQKIEALKTLKKFPAFEDKLDLDATDDIRKTLFEQLQEDGTCPGLDYDKDIAPWLGDRLAAALVDEGDAVAKSVLVVQITDEGKAKTGLDKLMACPKTEDSGLPSTDEKPGGFVVDGDWAVIAETEDVAKQVVDDTDNGTLADDEDYQHWTDEAGDDGILTIYAAPGSGEQLATFFAGDEALDEMSGMESSGAASDLVKKFEGAAAKVRFSDGDVEIEFAGKFAQTELSKRMTGDKGGDVVATLPDDTALAIGAAFEPGWFQPLMDQLAPQISEGLTGEDLVTEAETETGLELPEDAETLAGDSFALAVSSDFDVEKFVNSGDTSSLGVGVKVEGSAVDIEGVLGKLRTTVGDPSALESKTEGDYVAFGPDQGWVDQLSEDGNLGDTDTYREVLPDADRASSLFFLNVDAGDDWLVRMLHAGGAPDDVVDNVRPLSALGVASWTEDDITHATVKLTTD